MHVFALLACFGVLLPLGHAQPSPAELQPLYSALAHPPKLGVLHPRVPLSTDDPTSVPLVDLMVYVPPVTPAKSPDTGCTVTILKHDFGTDSYGKPAVVLYAPPQTKSCGKVGEWAAVTMNLTVYSNGTQYDRFSSLYLDHVEIWRHSSAEPTKTGTIWTAVKDVTYYKPLLSKNSTLMMDFSNIISAEYALDGVFNVTLTATYYPATRNFPSIVPASTILPLSTLSNTSANLFVVDSATPLGTTSVVIPPTTQRAFVEIRASGNSAEEFWYLNALDEALPYFPDPSVVSAKGPWREVQVLVDGKLAGAVWPFAVIYTGGITPTNWRPLTAFGAYDQPSYFVDVSPFLGTLTDGRPHNISLAVLGQGSPTTTTGSGSANANVTVVGGIGSNWFVSGALHLVTGRTRIKGKITSYSAPSPGIQNRVWSRDGNVTVEQSVRAQRKIRIEAELLGDVGKTKIVFEQDLKYENTQKYADEGWVQWASQLTTGTTKSTHGGNVMLRDAFSYPFDIFSNYSLYSEPYNAAYNSEINQTHIRAQSSPFGRPSTLLSIQHARGSVGLDAWPGLRHAVNGTGATSQEFAYVTTAAGGESYFRKISAVNDGWTADTVWGSLKDVEGPVPKAQIWPNGGPGF